uniref:Uncharacterized protein n=1 Tax=Anopheles dirus TaxID=7168 RepID=A0A182NY36_9DIPT
MLLPCTIWPTARGPPPHSISSFMLADDFSPLAFHFRMEAARTAAAFVV